MRSVIYFLFSVSKDSKKTFDFGFLTSVPFLLLTVFPAGKVSEEGGFDA